jgi:hypothetical protein
VRVEPEVEVNVGVSPAQADPQAAGGTTPTKGIGYLDGMRAAGYPLDLNNDLNTLVALKSLGNAGVCEIDGRSGTRQADSA